MGGVSLTKWITFRTELDSFCTQSVAPLLLDQVLTPQSTVLVEYCGDIFVLQSAEKVIKSFQGSSLQALMGEWFNQRVGAVNSHFFNRRLLGGVYHTCGAALPEGATNTVTCSELVYTHCIYAVNSAKCNNVAPL